MVLENKLRDVRKQAGLSQDKLAELAGVSRLTIIALENKDEINVKTDTLIKIAGALGERVRDIFFVENV